MPDGSSTAHLLRPKLGSLLGEGYRLASFRKDAVAALTVAIVALPLSMAIAVASGVSPERGLYTAIVGGFVVSLLSGSPLTGSITLAWKACCDCVSGGTLAIPGMP